MCALVTGVQTCALPILVDGAPGHGEGHNSGQAMNIVAALAVKDWMVRTNTAGTLVIWPGVAEELLGGKARFVRAGVFKDVDAAIFSHVSSQLATAWGQPNGTGMRSEEHTSELQSLMRISYAVFCLKHKNKRNRKQI